MTDLKKVAVITGCGNGIGLACARRFHERGYAIGGIDLKVPAEAAEVIEQSGGIFFEEDVSRFQRAREIVQDIARRLKRIDVLVPCAGISVDNPIDRLSEEDWDKVVDVDLKGTFNYISAAAAVFREQKSGKIVTIASTAALRARRSLSNYIAAKAGVIGLTRSAARDLGRYNVNVNAVAPGLVLTRLTEKIPEEIKAKLREETCLGRLAAPEDVAHVVYFLCTDEARHITGEVVRVDGGQLA